MRGIKTFVGLFPTSFRAKMRSQLWLFNLYSKSLQKSGLFYGFPSPEKLQKLYIKTIARQEVCIDELASRSFHCQFNVFLVVPRNVTALDAYIEELKGNGLIKKVFVMYENKQIAEHISINNLQAVFDFASFSEEDMQDPLLLLNFGDKLHSRALRVFSYHLNANDFSEGKVFYCDTDHLSNNGQRVNAEFYPDWNPDLQLSTGYVKTGVVLSGVELLTSFRGFANRHRTSGVIASWISNLYLFQSTQIVEHIPLSLVHRRLPVSYRWVDSLAKLENEKFEVAVGASHEIAEIKWRMTHEPLVSLIIPTKNAKSLVKTCIESILSKTEYTNFEILLVDNNSDEQDSLQYFQYLDDSHPKIKLLRYPHKFNYSAINNFAAKHASGDIIGLINNDIEVINREWLRSMVRHVTREDIGCVGAKLLYPDNRIQHAGVVMGYGGGAGHAHKYFPRYHAGYLQRLAATNNYSAVTAACLLVKTVDFWEVGGLNEKDLSVAFNDVDFCLRILGLGKRNVYCAEAELYHHESISRGADDTLEKRQRFERELAYIQFCWAKIISHDPAYNPNLTLRHENFSIRE